MHLRFILILLFLAIGGKSWATDSVPAQLLRLGDGRYFSSTAIVVDKANRTLTVWEFSEGQLIKRTEFPSDLGKNVGPKQARGDKRTPEGVYFLEKLLEGSELNFQEYGIRAFTTNYPNLFDARQGLTGDGIWLHAIPDKVSLERGSKGCVVVRNDAILELSKFIKVGQTPIIITNSVTYLPRVELEAQAGQIESTIESWRKAWQSKDLESYMSFYDKEFESLKMNREQWRSFKSGLNQKYQTIKIDLSKPAIFDHHGKVIVRTLQKYQSDKHSDFGEKLIYLERRGTDYKIVAEEWKPVQNPEALQAMIVGSQASPN